MGITPRQIENELEVVGVGQTKTYWLDLNNGNDANDGNFSNSAIATFSEINKRIKKNISLEGGRILIELVANTNYNIEQNFQLGIFVLGFGSIEIKGNFSTFLLNSLGRSPVTFTIDSTGSSVSLFLNGITFDTNRNGSLVIKNQNNLGTEENPITVKCSLTIENAKANSDSIIQSKLYDRIKISRCDGLNLELSFNEQSNVIVNDSRNITFKKNTINNRVFYQENLHYYTFNNSESLIVEDLNWRASNNVSNFLICDRCSVELRYRLNSSVSEIEVENTNAFISLLSSEIRYGFFVFGGKPVIMTANAVFMDANSTLTIPSNNLSDFVSGNINREKNAKINGSDFDSEGVLVTQEDAIASLKSRVDNLESRS